ncbi:MULTISPECIES: hypothetical protein [Haloferax]|uniref:Lipoprotein n=1 Tax=Haloferax marinum TaxID=2666143 RepID=A0A6A8G963_9EURY|nr:MULTISPECIES: hypothetical protein [Haloferax]KAB1198078.1 hypothetical protein Hfx1150_11315 [Haloferax sp. CBA1150]MRW97148.1 hypothetical protein [Haloferax marinum]
MRWVVLLLVTISMITLGGCVGSGDGLTEAPSETVTTETPVDQPVSETPANTTSQLTTTPTPSNGGGGQVKLRVKVVETIPENTTVRQYNTSSPPPQTIKQTLDSALASNDGFDAVSLSESQESEVQKELDSISTDSESSAIGYYVQYQNETFRLMLIQLE